MFRVTRDVLKNYLFCWSYAPQCRYEICEALTADGIFPLGHNNLNNSQAVMMPEFLRCDLR